MTPIVLAQPPGIVLIEPLLFPAGATVPFDEFDAPLALLTKFSKVFGPLSTTLAANTIPLWQWFACLQ
jgi:hypothetical protein